MDRETEEKIESFRSWLKLHRSALTMKNYINTVNLFFSFVGKSINDVTIDDVVRFLGKYDNRNTVARHANALRVFFRYVGREDIADKVPIPKRELPPVVGVTDDDVVVGLKAMDEDWWVRRYPNHLKEVYRLRDKLLILVSYWCGLRIGEAHSLNLSDVDFDGKKISVLREKVRERQEIPLPDSLLELIREYVGLRDDGDDAFFVCGDPPKRCSKEMLRRLFKKFARAIGKPNLTFHSLRHGRGTKLARDKQDVLTIALWLHHKNPKTSMRYIHLTIEDLRKRVLRGEDWDLPRSS